MWRKALIIQIGGEIEALRSTIEKLRSYSAEIVVLCPASISQSVMSEADQVLMHGAIAEAGLSSVPEQLFSLIELLKIEQFDAAIVQLNQNTSPYPLAYVCYLAGIPVRIGRSREFGGGVLSHCMDACEEFETVINRVQEVA